MHARAYGFFVATFPRANEHVGSCAVEACAVLFRGARGAFYYFLTGNVYFPANVFRGFLVFGVVVCLAAHLESCAGRAENLMFSHLGCMASCVELLYVAAATFVIHYIGSLP